MPQLLLAALAETITWLTTYLLTAVKIGSAIGGTIGVGLDGLAGIADEGLLTARLSKSGGELGKKVADRLST